MGVLGRAGRVASVRPAWLEGDPRRYSLRLELIDATVTVALVPILAWEVTHRGDTHWLLAALNAALFAVLALLLVLRIRRGEWGAMRLPRKFVEATLLVVAFPLLSVVGPLRLLRLLRLPLLGVRSLGTLRARVVQTGPVLVVLGAVFTVVIGSLFVLEFECGDPDSDIVSLGDGVWWAVTTMTTVGYGDLSPATFGGRVTAVGVMVLGITLFGLATALIAKWLVGGSDTDEPVTKAQMAGLAVEIARLREELRAGPDRGRSP